MNKMTKFYIAAALVFLCFTVYSAYKRESTMYPMLMCWFMLTQAKLYEIEEAVRIRKLQIDLKLDDDLNVTSAEARHDEDDDER